MPERVVAIAHADEPLAETFEQIVRPGRAGFADGFDVQGDPSRSLVMTCPASCRLCIASPA